MKVKAAASLEMPSSCRLVALQQTLVNLRYSIYPEHDHFQNLIIPSVVHNLPNPFVKSTHNFMSYLANIQTRVKTLRLPTHRRGNQ